MYWKLRNTQLTAPRKYLHKTSGSRDQNQLAPKNRAEDTINFLVSAHAGECFPPFNMKKYVFMESKT